MYLQTEFLVLVQAVEALHRRRGDGGYLDDASFGILLKALQDEVRNHRPTINEEAMIAFMSKLNYLNEYALKRRLEELIADLGSR